MKKVWDWTLGLSSLILAKWMVAIVAALAVYNWRIA